MQTFYQTVQNSTPNRAELLQNRAELFILIRKQYIFETLKPCRALTKTVQTCCQTVQNPDSICAELLSIIPCRSVSFPVIPCHTLSFPGIPCRSLSFPLRSRAFSAQRCRKTLRKTCRWASRGACKWACRGRCRDTCGETCRGAALSAFFVNAVCFFCAFW